MPDSGKTKSVMQPVKYPTVILRRYAGRGPVYLRDGLAQEFRRILGIGCPGRGGEEKARWRVVPFVLGGKYPGTRKPADSVSEEPAAGQKIAVDNL